MDADAVDDGGRLWAASGMYAFHRGQEPKGSRRPDVRVQSILSHYDQLTWQMGGVHIRSSLTPLWLRPHRGFEVMPLHCGRAHG